ncbi:MAG: hypothetical protein GX117_09955 [Candidatus Hydrogenedentes bacterium]|nr:hypothetical protein [Candidatus Hydrogenedentota bacterium]
MRLKYQFFALLFSIAFLALGCAKDRASDAVFTDSQFTATPDEAQTRLKDIVRDQISENSASREPQVLPVIYRRPYYFKEYFIYTDAIEDVEIEFRDNDSRARPLIAEVKLNKIRYSTQMHRKEARAAADTDFLRDVGEELLVYEWRNGRWIKTGAIFDARTTEEQINGAWVPHEEETVRVNPEEDQRGWFGRMWERIRGGE